MKACLVFLGLLALGQALNVEVRQEKNRPVSKVINLLKDMIKQLEKEGEEDEDIYEKMGCWCVTNEKEKKQSVADAQARITELTATIEESASDFARLNAEIGNLNKELGENTDALDSATALRGKQLAEFNEEEKDALTSIVSLKGAVQVLSKQHSSALLQSDGQESINVIASLRQVFKRHRAMFKETVSPHDRKMVEAMVGSSFAQQSAGATYDPQSGAIFGVLKQMKEDFETNLASSQKEETSNVAAYEDLKAAKTAQIAAGQEQVDTKSKEAAAADEKKATAKEDLEETRASLAADNKFLEDLMLRCQAMDQEFTERTETRQQEIQATSKALEFLSSDEAHDLFTRTFNPALVQRRAQADSKRRAELEKLLREAGKRSGDPRVSALAVSARLDAFEEVKKTIKGMIDKLLKEKDDDIKHKDYCIDEFNTNEVNTQNKYRERDEVVAEIEAFQANVDELDKAIAQLKAEVDELTVQQKRASKDREKANADFQAVVADQEATEKLLTTALGVLKSFYDKAALAQTQAKAKATGGQAPPPGFKTYEKSAASGGVMGMMQKIIDEAKAMKAEAVRGEEEAQASYEEFTKDTTESLDTKNKDIVSKSAAKAKAEKDKIHAEEHRDTALSEIEELAQIDADLHKSCDFLMKNFDIRVESRDSEVEALKKGLALFSGASFGALLQRY